MQINGQYREISSLSPDECTQVLDCAIIEFGGFNNLPDDLLAQLAAQALSQLED